MATKTYHIEIKVMNVDTPERVEAVRTAMKRVARNGYAACLLICGEDPPPEILIYQEDFESGRVEIDQNEGQVQ